MNIDKIVKKYPLAFKDYLSTHTGVKTDKVKEIVDVEFKHNGVILGYIEFIDRTCYEFNFHFRELYDYFASVGIRFETFIQTDANAKYIGTDIFVYITDADGCLIQMGKLTDKELIQCEYKAFELSYELRNNQLKEV